MTCSIALYASRFKDDAIKIGGRCAIIGSIVYKIGKTRSQGYPQMKRAAPKDGPYAFIESTVTNEIRDVCWSS